MAKRNVSFVDEHIEKVAIGVCALVLFGAVWYAFLSKPFIIGQDVTPARLREELSRESDAVAQSVRSARPKADNTGPVVEPAEEMRKWFGEGAPGLIPEAGIAQTVPRTQPFPPLLVSATETTDANRHGLARFVTPGIPVVSSGRTTFFIRPDKPDLGSYDDQDQRAEGEERQYAWFSVGAQVDLIDQNINFQAAKYPPGAFPDIVQVHLQRYDEDEPWRGWQDVETYRPYRPFDRPAADPSGANMSEVFAFSRMIAAGQEPIARPLLPARASGDRLKYPRLPYYPDPPNRSGKDIAALATSWYRGAKEAESGKGGDRDLDGAFILARAVLGESAARDKDKQEARTLLDKVGRAFAKDSRRKPFLNEPIRSPEQLMPIVAHDLTAAPGHTYRYRLRYEVFNLFAGNPGELNNRADAGKLTILSDWSPPSRSVTIESDLRFFLTEVSDADRKKAQATVTVHKKSRSGWKKAEFTIKVGDAIGEKRTKGKDQGDFTTSAVCVEIDFNRRSGKRSDVVLVYVDTDTGRLGELSLSAGKDDSEKLARAG